MPDENRCISNDTFDTHRMTSEFLYVATVLLVRFISEPTIGQRRIVDPVHGSEFSRDCLRSRM